MKRVAACTCGQLTATVEGEPSRISVCHCLDCQRRTGGVFSMQARFALEDVTTRGEGVTYARVGGSGATMTKTFCPRCGVTVFYQNEGDPRIAIPVGTFADPSFPAPTVSVFEKRKHGWVQMPEGITRE